MTLLLPTSLNIIGPYSMMRSTIKIQVTSNQNGSFKMGSYERTSGIPWKLSLDLVDGT